MSYKKLIYSGIIIILASFLIGILGAFWGIHNSFDALRTNETASIDAVGAGIEKALLSTIISIIGLFVGLILIIVGGVKANRQLKEVN